MDMASMHNKMTAKKAQRRHLCVFYSVILFALIMICTWHAVRTMAANAPSVFVSEINYTDSTITIQANAKDTAVYVSDYSGKVWDRIPGELTSDHKITMDISWIPVSSKYTLRLKGDVSTSIATVILPKQQTSFRATYNKVKGNISVSNQGSRTIQWRKKDSYLWKTLDLATFSSEISMLCTQGATLSLRLAPVNGGFTNGVFSSGARPSKEVTLTIPKKTPAPAITINGSALLIQGMKNLTYRTQKSDGTYTDWITLNSAKKLRLQEIAPSVLYTDGQTVQSEVTMQFKKNATSSSQVSQIKTITIPIQKAAPIEEENGISISYTSSTSLEVQIKAASTAKPFEYTIVKDKNTLDYEKASWTTISSGTAVAISKKAAPTGSHIYVRLKSMPATETVPFSLASKELDVTGSSGVAYPNAAAKTDMTSLMTIAGACDIDHSAGYLTFTLYSPTKTTVSSMSFRDSYGNVRGKVTVTSSVAVNSKASESKDQYIITTKITSTKELDAVTSTMLYADITFANQDTITSTNTSGISLYLYPAAVVNNTGHKTYTDRFERVLDSTESSDDTSFTFRLEFGSVKVPDLMKTNTWTEKDMEVAGLSFDSYPLKEGTDYSVVYGTDQKEDQQTVRTATITVDVSKFENASSITTIGSAVPLIVNLNDGEKLDQDVTITLVKTATLCNTPLAWSIMEGSLKEKEKTTVTNEDNTTTTSETEVTTFALELDVFSKTYDVGVADVTWGGRSILKSASLLAGKIKINLSNPKINQLTTTSSTTNNVVITFSNGYVIKTGCKLTIINSD